MLYFTKNDARDCSSGEAVLRHPCRNENCVLGEEKHAMSMSRLDIIDMVGGEWSGSGTAKMPNEHSNESARGCN
ncbi:MAG: hypothetical protein IJJ71_10650 [Treponema sp.]|uniref:hypothetical protein n=1 Tax=Treponema sp. TaxID=166 RepID=UPI0025E40A25|nr:hypothetical protein [Treponema sp.]MBR0496620.1 hypothetical protein [Treponema sp.]